MNDTRSQRAAKYNTNVAISYSESV